MVKVLEHYNTDGRFDEKIYALKWVLGEVEPGPFLPEDQMRARNQREPPRYEYEGLLRPLTETIK